MIREAFRSVWDEPRSPGAPARVWWDWVLVAVFVVTAILESVLREEVPWRPLVLLHAVTMAVVVPWRRTHPLLVVVLGFGSGALLGAADLAFDADGYVGLNTAALVLIFPYALLRWGSGREVVIGLAVMLVAGSAGIAADYNGVGEAVAGGLALLFPAVLGLAVRWQAHARRRELEQLKLEERGQLARELHDTVAHHVTAIVVRAQAGRVLAASDPAAAVEALGVIEDEASHTLMEMRAMVGVLRDGRPADLVPHRGVVDIVGLGRVEPVPRIDVEVPADLGDLPPVTGSALFRIAQESVTNSLRHARGATRVEVRLSNDDDRVRIMVRDDGAPVPALRGTGYGLIGMNERAALLGGELEAGAHPSGGWVVDAVLPRNRALE
ncbi:MAG: sensor histidine kinase [Microthrixaceae bacterium]